MNIRFLLISILFIGQTSISFGQIKIGVKANPVISYARPVFNSVDATASRDKSALKIQPGIIVDYGLSENYYFSSGISFISKKTAVTVMGDVLGTFSEVHDVQYIQLPVTMKLFTNEISLDKRIYFQLGPSFDIKVHDTLGQLGSDLIEQFNFMDISIHVAAGLEMTMGSSTVVYGGIVFNKGMMNQTNKTNPLLNDNLVIKSDFIGLDIGVKF